jgi:hypothetical protein
MALLRVFPADHEEAHVRIGQQVADQVLDAQVLRVQAADDGQARRAWVRRPAASIRSSELRVHTATGA